MDSRPAIVAFLCSWCAYAGADRAGVTQLPVPEGVRTVRVPCSGAVEAQMIVSAFEAGADAVLVLACHPGDCHHIDGNRRAFQRHIILSRLLEQMGIDAGRLVFDYVSATEGERFARIVAEALDRISLQTPLEGEENR